MAGAIAPKRFLLPVALGRSSRAKPKVSRSRFYQRQRALASRHSGLDSCYAFVAYPVRLRHDAARRNFRIVLERLFNAGKGFSGESSRLQRGYTLPGCRAVWHVADMDYPLGADVPGGQLVDLQRVLTVRAGQANLVPPTVGGRPPGDDRALWRRAVVESSPCAGSGQSTAPTRPRELSRGRAGPSCAGRALPPHLDLSRHRRPADDAHRELDSRRLVDVRACGRAGEVVGGVSEVQVGAAVGAPAQRPSAALPSCGDLLSGSCGNSTISSFTTFPLQLPGPSLRP